MGVPTQIAPLLNISKGLGETDPSTELLLGGTLTYETGNGKREERPFELRVNQPWKQCDVFRFEVYVWVFGLLVLFCCGMFLYVY